MPSGNQSVDGTEHTICFHHVTFAYRQKEVLKNVNLEIKPKTLTAFVGPSGAGKSTAALLIPRFWDIKQGNIEIDGVDIRDLSLDHLMDLVSFVFQDTFLLHDTLFQNIAIGKEGSTLEDVKKAAKATQIDDFIESLPNGYQTMIGEKGMKLSGGQKQRICIARAILKDAPIIIFDEATSFTDIENEYQIQKALEQLLKGKTTIMIAHRLHTIIHADQICVFDHGEIKETGTHDELLKKQGIYQKMWDIYRQRGEEDV